MGGPEIFNNFAIWITTIFAICGFFFHGVTLLSLYLFKSLRREKTTNLIVTLCISDLLYSFEEIRFRFKLFSLANDLESISLSFRLEHPVLSIAHIMIITTNRCFTICAPKWHEKIFTARKMTAMVMVYWSKILIMSIIRILHHHFQTPFLQELYGFTLFRFQTYWYIGNHAIAFTLIIISYYFMNKKVKKCREKSLSQNKNYKKKENEDAEIYLKFMMILLIAFIIIYLPDPLWSFIITIYEIPPSVWKTKFFKHFTDYFFNILRILHSFHIFLNFYTFYCTDRMYLAAYRQILLYPIYRRNTISSFTTTSDKNESQNYTQL